MYIVYDGNNYPCVCTPAATMNYGGLPEDFPAPISGEVVLCADDGFVMRTDNSNDYLRQTFENGVLTLTNVPEPEPITPEEPVEPDYTPTPQDDTDAMLVDHEYRITLLELGVV